MDRPLEHDLGGGRHLQVVADAGREFGAPAAQQPGELVLGQRVRHRRHRTEGGRRVAAQRHRDRERLPRVRLRMVAEVERAAPMREPAHDQLVAADHLLPVDAEVLPRARRAARDGEAPGDQRPGVAWPAGLDRQPAEIDLAALDALLLAGRPRHLLRRHVQHLLEQRPLVPGIAQPLRRLGLFQVGQQLADLAQRGRVVLPHAERDALRGAEQVAEHRHRMAGRVLEQDGRPAGPQHAVAHLGHLEVRGDRRGDALQFAEGLELRDEVAQVVVFQVGSCSVGF